MNESDNKPLQNDFNSEDEVIHYPLPQPPKKSHKALWIWLVILVLLIGGAIAGYWWYKHRSTKAVDNVTYGSSQATGLKQLCFLRLSYLVCTDADGNNRVRYDLPVPPSGTQFTSLGASADQSTFVAFASNYAGTAQTQSQVVVFNGSLSSAKQLTFPDGLVPVGSPTLSADGKTVYLELDGKSNDRQLYSYDIATSKATQLTSNGANMLPQFTKDGHIVYSSYAAGGSWQPYIMDKDGKNQRLLIQAATVFKPFGFSYDYASDVVYLFGDLGAEPQILHGTVADFLANKAPDVIHANADSSDYSVARLSDGRILIDKQTQGIVLDVATGKQVGTIDHYGTQVGWLDVSKFTRSKQQAEQPYDRIIGLASAPDDFQTFLKSVFDQQDAACQGAPDGVQFHMVMRQVVRDSFAEVNQGCDGGAAYFYAKANGAWTTAFHTQAGVQCSLVNQYKFTKEIVPECYEANNQLVANTNP